MSPATKAIRLGGGFFLHLGLCLLAARAVEHEQFWESGQVIDRLDKLHRLPAIGAQRRSWDIGCHDNAR